MKSLFIILQLFYCAIAIGQTNTDKVPFPITTGDYQSTRFQGGGIGLSNTAPSAKLHLYGTVKESPRISYSPLFTANNEPIHLNGQPIMSDHIKQVLFKDGDFWMGKNVDTIYTIDGKWIRKDGELTFTRTRQFDIAPIVLRSDVNADDSTFFYLTFDGRIGLGETQQKAVMNEVFTDRASTTIYEGVEMFDEAATICIMYVGGVQYSFAETKSKTRQALWLTSKATGEQLSLYYSLPPKK